MSTSLAKLPFCSFALTGSGTNGVGRAWQLDIDLEANRPMKFFGLSVFYDGPTDNPAALDELHQRISDTIRYHKQLLAGHRVSVTNDDFFEQCLQKINAEINVFLRDWSGPLPLQSWAMVLGMLTPESSSSGRLQFFVSRFGDISAWLLHTAQLETKKMINIFDAPDPLVNTGGPQKFFKNILSSSLSTQDQIVFCTPNIFHYASLSDIKKILTTLSVSSAIKQIENHVSAALVDSAAAALSLRLAPYPMVERSVVTQRNENAQRSMQTLTQTESQTEQLLASTVGVNFKRLSGGFKRLFATLRRYSEDENKTVHNGKTTSKSRPLKPLVKGVVKAARFVSLSISRLIPRGKGGTAAKSPIGRPEYVSTHATVTKVSGFSSFLASASRASRTIVASLFTRRSPKMYGAVLIICLLVVGGLYWRSVRAEEARLLAETKAALEGVSTNLDRVDSYLIVGREADALDLVHQSELALQSAGTQAELQANREQLSQRISEQRRRLRKEIIVRNPAIVIDDVATRLNSPAKQILPTDKGFIVLGENPRTIIEYTVQSDQAQSRTITTDMERWTEATWIDEGQIAFTDGANITIATLKNGSASTQKATSPSPISAIVSYNSRLYALSPNERQVMRSNRAPNLAVFAGWLKQSDEALTQARDLAIDGSIYVLLSNGLRQYTQGVPASGLKLDSVEPALVDAKRLSYQTDGQHFFIIENNRLLAYKKTGKFVAQYILESGAQMRDIYVDEALKTAYVVTDDAVISFPIQI